MLDQYLQLLTKLFTLMEKDYRRMYLMMTRNNMLYEHCRPSNFKMEFGKNGLVELLDVNKSIQETIHKSSNQQEQKKLENTSMLLNPQFNTLRTRKRIHHNVIDYSSLNSKSGSLKYESPSPNLLGLNTVRKQRSHKSTILLPTQKDDVYEQHIESYLSTKFETEMLAKYLNNKKEFIQEACQQIQAQIKKQEKSQLPVNKLKMKKRSKSNKLPHLMEKIPIIKQKSSFSSILQAAYLKQLNQIKKSEEIQAKYRKRQQQQLNRKMSKIEQSIIILKDN